MFIILGGTGHVGSRVTSTLLEFGEEVTVVTSDAAKASAWEEKGARLAEVDVHDTARLRDVLRTGKRAFLLSPPAPPSTDTDAEERATVASIVAAVDGSGLERVVVESTTEPGQATVAETSTYSSNSRRASGGWGSPPPSSAPPTTSATTISICRMSSRPACSRR